MAQQIKWFLHTHEDQSLQVYSYIPNAGLEWDQQIQGGMLISQPNWNIELQVQQNTLSLNIKYKPSEEDIQSWSTISTQLYKQIIIYKTIMKPRKNSNPKLEIL